MERELGGEGDGDIKLYAASKRRMRAAFTKAKNTVTNSKKLEQQQVRFPSVSCSLGDVQMLPVCRIKGYTEVLRIDLV